MNLGYTQTTITPLLENPAYLAGFGKYRIAERIHYELSYILPKDHYEETMSISKHIGSKL